GSRSAIRSQRGAAADGAKTYVCDPKFLRPNLKTKGNRGCPRFIGIRTSEIWDLPDAKCAGLEFLLCIEKTFVKLHAKRKPQGLKLVLDLIERLLAEITVLEHLLLGLHRQLANRRD